VLHRFGIFEFDSDSGELRKSGRGVSLEPQPAKALGLLLARAGHVVSREEMRDAVWGQDTHVDFDRGLAYCISQVRTALGDSGENPRFVQTVPKRGFKFIAPISTEAPGSSGSAGSKSSNGWLPAVLSAGLIIVLAIGWAYSRGRAGEPVVIAVSVFDNETGMPEHDRLVAGLSDIVVTRLTQLAPDRMVVIGNAEILRKPRNLRNLKAIADDLPADFVLLGQLQRDERGLRFITHFIRLRDEAHLKANRLVMRDGGVAGLEAAVVEEFERAVREHVLNRPAN
jgi:DNA-binding winged helix-turn-helix (wHTH) protein/TolB-like protein